MVDGARHEGAETGELLETACAAWPNHDGCYWWPTPPWSTRPTWPPPITAGIRFVSRLPRTFDYETDALGPARRALADPQLSCPAGQAAPTGWQRPSFRGAESTIEMVGPDKIARRFRVLYIYGSEEAGAARASRARLLSHAEDALASIARGLADKPRQDPERVERRVAQAGGRRPRRPVAANRGRPQTSTATSPCAGGATSTLSPKRNGRDGLYALVTNMSPEPMLGQTGSSPSTKTRRSPSEPTTSSKDRSRFGRCSCTPTAEPPPSSQCAPSPCSSTGSSRPKPAGHHPSPHHRRTPPRTTSRPTHRREHLPCLRRPRLPTRSHHHRTPSHPGPSSPPPNRPSSTPSRSPPSSHPKGETYPKTVRNTGLDDSRAFSSATTDTQVACSRFDAGLTVGADWAKPSDDLRAATGCSRGSKGARAILPVGAVRVDMVISKGLRARLSLFPTVRFPPPRPKDAHMCLSERCWHHLPNLRPSPFARSPLAALPLSLRCFRAGPADAEQRTSWLLFIVKLKVPFCGSAARMMSAPGWNAADRGWESEGEADGDGPGGDGSRCRARPSPPLRVKPAPQACRRSPPPGG